MKQQKIKDILGLKLTKDEFVTEVLILACEDGIKYTEAILEVCKRHDIEPEDVGPLVTGNLRERLKLEAMSYKNIPDTRGNTLFT